MFFKPYDLISIGDITTDAFIRLKDAHIHCRINREDCELCLRFGDKVPFESIKIIKAVGNAANTAVAGARLGLKTALVSNIGADQNGKDCLVELQKNKVVTSLVKVHKNKISNYHFVLWYGNDRTILTNHINYDYRLPRLFPAKWIYLTSIAPDTHPYHTEIIEYLKKNKEVKLAFQPGTYQLKLGYVELKYLYERADFLSVNLDEAKKILVGAKLKIDYIKNSGSTDIKKLLESVADLGPKLVAITDGPRGAYLYDGDHFYHMPIYPDPRPALERTGCGDAWSATFVSSLAMGKTPLEALTLAPVNAMSVAQFVGSQEGLLTIDQIEWWLKQAPSDYKPREI